MKEIVYEGLTALAFLGCWIALLGLEALLQ
jgi:hypothetical protein